ncbi:MAG: YegP family protein [Clostridia bacterium]|nr:YegP family protein [Clostridia bacterium]
MGKFVIKTTKTGIKFDLKAGNGEVIATSEVYKSLNSCKKGIASVQKNAPKAAVEDQTVEGFAKEKHPKFEIYKDKAGEFRFRLKATNGQIIAVSEGYKAMKSCVNGIDSVKKNAADAKVETAKEEEKAAPKKAAKAKKK